MTSQPNILERIQNFAVSKPDVSAVTCENQKLTFGEFNSAANQLAHFLQEQGVLVETPVALCVKRSLEFPLGMLGIFKSGATYIPLDPEHPQQRLLDLIRETGTKIIITQRELVKNFEGVDGTVIVLEDCREQIRKYNTVNLPLPDANHVAYLMFTSGTTGKPKGVQIEHGTLAARFPLSPYHLLMNDQDNLAGITAASYNPSIYETLYTLANGSKLAICTADVTRDPVLLQQFIKSKNITFMRAVPSLLRALIDAGWTGKLDMTIVSHGEKLDSTLAEDLRTRGKALYNTYGSTEATIFSMVQVTSEEKRVIPIGTNDTLMVLNDQLQVVAPGETGEIYYSGAIIARGYFGDEKLTAEKFILNHDGSKRFYKTGDLARRLTDGTIEFLGRADNQVKIRGQRIELGEVEAAIAKFPEVKSVIVHTAEDKWGALILAAYVIPQNILDITKLRNYLISVLPEVMIPSVFMTMNSFPLNENGKVNRKALPKPTNTSSETSVSQPLETETQKVVANIFAEILNINHISPDDYFFELGGHSLSAAMVCSRLREEYFLDFSLKYFYQKPTVRDLASDIEQRKNRGEHLVQAAIDILPVRKDVPLSFAQERLWFMNKLSGEDAGYNLPMAWSLKGELKLQALEASINFILNRHETLRTSFHADATGKPLQTVHEVMKLDLAPINASESSVRMEILNDVNTPFNLTAAPLLRSKLFRLGNNEHVLYVNLHHIASDGWSNAIFRRELVLAYEAFAENRLPVLKKLSIQYLDYAAWHRSYLAEGELKKQLEYWTQELAELEPLNMPTDRPRPKILSQKGEVEKLVIAPEVLARLNTLALKHNASLYMVLMAAFKLLLFRYCGQKDIAVGSPIAGRVKPETEGLIGFFVNTLVLRSNLSSGKTFLNLLQEVREKALSAYTHQDLPFERLVSEINPQRDLSRYPLTQTIFALQNTPYDEVKWTGIKAEKFDFKNETTRFDMELHAWERDEGLRCHLIYNTELFDQWRMQQFLVHFKTVLEFISLQPDTAIGLVPILSELDKKKILIDWNQTKATFPSDLCVHQLIEKKALEFPNHLAISSNEGQLTFSDYNKQANQLAHYLIKLGVKPADRVALCLPRSADLMIGMLGAMKVGATYVPLDPDYPQDRLRFMLKDSKAKILLTYFEFAHPLQTAEVKSISLNTYRETIARESNNNPEVSTHPDLLAYIIYTSGTTGTPNGVKIAHRGLVNLVTYSQKLFKVTEKDRVSNLTSPAFDAAAFEVWTHLSAGAAMFIPDKDSRMIIGKLVEWMEKNKLSLCFLPTAYMEQLYEMKLPPSLRMLSVGGDRLQNYPPANFVSVVNLYGPTENTVVSTAAVLGPRKEHDPILPTIGKTIANHQAYILDEELNPVPIGVVGELVLGGIGIAAGYEDRPELTAKKFIPNVFTGEGKLYRTGDLARYLPDGQIDFLGRVDHQIKIRGYRIEPGEITSAILTYPNIKDAFTMVREDSPGDKRLVSYIVTDGKIADPELETKHVAGWQQLYEREYTHQSSETEFNITGWNSSFTGEAIPAEAMSEWVESTVTRIKEFYPQNILEIGCGSGLLLFPLVETAQKYTATDISVNTIEKIRRYVAPMEKIRNKIVLLAGPAHHLQIGKDNQFDTVIMNSVIQYFPNAMYLKNVIKEVVPQIISGGRFFIGDVRNFDLLYAFHLQVELSRGSEDDVTANLKQKVEMRAMMDKELLLSPFFFYNLTKEIPRITAVEIKPKLGKFKTEMNMFRYDVILHIDTVIKQKKSVQIIQQGIPDPRNENILRANRYLQTLEKNERVSDFKTRFSKGEGSSIEHYFDLAKDQGMVANVRLSANSETFDVLFSKQPEIFSFEPDSNQTTAHYNDPLQHERISSIRPQLREYLSKKLPDYMIPSSLVFLESLPITSNGKIDRKKLPIPTSERPELLKAYVPPQTDIEKILAEIFSRTLGIDVVGIYDNFFELGGHSLLAVQLVSLIEDRLGAEIALTTLFEGPTVAELATRLSKKSPVSTMLTEAALDIKKLPLAAMDANFHYGRIHLKSNQDAWYQVMELTVKSLDQKKLEAAILYAVNKHPIARGKLSSLDGLGNNAYWDVSLLIEKVPLAIHVIQNEEELEKLREEIITTSFALNEAPTCRFVWISGLPSERLFLRYNHGALDASGLQCLINSLMAHYTGQKDPVKRILPLSNEDFFNYYDYRPGLFFKNNEAANFKGSIFKPLEILAAQIHPMGGIPGSSGCSAIEIEFSANESQALSATAKTLKSTLDRLFMIGILKGATNWNQRFSKRPGRIEAYWAVNLRPPKMFDSIVANQFAWSRVRAPNSAQEKAMLKIESDFLLRGALDWIHYVSRFHQWPIPTVLRRLFIKFANLALPSMMISNTLTVSMNEADKGPLAAAFGLSSMKNHSRFASTNRPVIVIGRIGNSVFIRMTYPDFQFDREGAIQFLEICKKSILEIKQ